MKKNLIVSALTALMTLGILASAAFGQHALYTQNSADQTLRSAGRVNPSTLAMEMQIPLGGYPGRGMSLPINLSYSSKLWRMRYLNTTPVINNPTNCHPLSEPLYSENSASGWTSGMSIPYIEYTGMDNIYGVKGFPLSYDAGSCASPDDGYNNYVRKIEAHLPNGETHELRADDTVKYYPASSSCHVSGQFCDPNEMDLPANWNTTYYATDGSNLEYVQDSTTGIYKLLMPDGSFFAFAASITTLPPNNNATVRKAVSLNDRNGNTILYHEPDAQYANGSETDTLGRVIPIPVGLQAPSATASAEIVQPVQLPGFGGSSVITYQLRWKRLKGDTAAASGLTNFSQNLSYRANGNPYPNSPQPPAGSTLLFHDVGSAWAVAAAADQFNPTVLTEIDLPNGASYRFSYDIYGRIEQITYPTGGTETFHYDVIPALAQTSDPGSDITLQANFGVTQRQVLESSGATPMTSTYSGSYDGLNGYKVRTVMPDGTKTERYSYRGNAICTGCEEGTFGYDNALAGMAYEERAYTSGQTDTLLSKKLTTWATTQMTVASINGVSQTAGWHPRVTKEESIIYDPASGVPLSASVTTDYDGDLTQRNTALNANKVKQYGFSTTIGSLGALQKSIETTYKNDANYTANNLRSLPSLVQTKNAGGVVVAQSQIVYDEANYLESVSITNVTGWQNLWTSCRGLPTTTQVWNDTSAAWIDTHAEYDQFGNLRKGWDGRGNVSTMDYSSTYGYAYPTQVTSAVPSDGTYGSNTAFTTSTAYDPTTGLPTSTVDANNQTTQIIYLDPVTHAVEPFLRVRQVIAPNGQQTITEYGAGVSAATRYVKVSSQLDATKWKVGYSSYDGLGRTTRTQSVNPASGDVFVDTQYDNIGRVQQVSNPYRTGETLYWTTNTYDDLGRVTKVKTPDNAEVNTAYSLATTGSEIGAVVTATDQAGKQRRSVTNALGQLKRVDEPTDAGGLGVINSPNQYTLYGYDALNNLTAVNQGSQTRSFAYDSLSRLKTATNPESGTINYTYDNNGNLRTKIDARNITTTFDYDNLNRVKSRIYSDGTTPAVSYYYDNLANAKGRLIKVDSSVSTTEYTSFDVMGRVLTHRQTTDGVAYTTGYSYNLAGALLTETYPSSRVVKNVLDSDGDLSMVQSKKISGAGYWNYAQHFSFTAAGAVSSMQLGNGKWESTLFNSRLQPTQIALGTVQNGTDNLKLNYDYGTTTNNGNVQSQTITVPTVGNAGGFTATQNYTYDSVNRLKSATENISGSQSWKQTFVYDRFGNRNFDTSNGNTTTLGTCSQTQCNPTIDAANNRFTTGQGYSYDFAGNVIADAQGRTFNYDGENKQTSVTNSGSAVGTYFYDGDGKRVKKYIPSTQETTIFVYDAGGKMVAEYATTPSPTPQVSYLTNDNLGTPRINTNAAGAVIARHDYLPFGEEIDSNITPIRNVNYNYGDEGIRQKFTSYERDNESQLDFAQARYYSNQHGRFTTVDPLMASARISNPKTWNRYAYVLNNPLRFIDPDGMDVQVLDEKARNNLLKTLPEEIRKQVEKLINKNGVIKKGALDKIKSKDQNFKDLKTMVNNKDLTEVMTATNSTGENSANFFQRTAAENKEYDIQNYMKNNNVSREEAEKLFKDLGTTWEDSAYYGYTLNPSESPSGYLRIVVTDQTGEAANVSEETAVVSTGHELYGHGLLYRQGKPYGHDKVPGAFFDAIEKRTQTNYRSGEQKANTPKNIKPNQ